MENPTEKISEGGGFELLTWVDDVAAEKDQYGERDE